MVEDSDASCIRAATTRRHMTGDGAATYTYDDAGRMVSATQAGVTSTYAINALGQRVRKTTSGVSTYFVYDEAGHLLGEYDNTGTLIQETIWFEDTPVATIKPNGSGGINLFYIHTDHLNTPRRISRPSDNAVVWRWDSDPFGSSAANEDPDGDTQLFTFNLRFPGTYADSETGLHYNYFRDYDPATGRYPQSDPIGLEGGINTYAYAKSSPTMIVDPYGLWVSDYFTCMFQQARHGGAGDCRNKFFASASALAEKENERQCKVIGEAVECVTTCALRNFVGANFTEVVVNAHEEVFINRLNRIARETANKYAKRFLPLVGQYDTFTDAVGTIECTTNCSKR